ncbi:MAG: SDR family NAD(P)-dependent oxidoreductase, partial [Verrucomicrobiota bacterium]|nr:SDR family NAD(P)-dependent oxidoreductase [Verrucomicrobiota bacterium]
MSLAPLAEKLFSLKGRVAVITGGAGLLGIQHDEIIAAAGGIPVLLDLDADKANEAARKIATEFSVDAWGVAADIRDSAQVTEALRKILERHARLDILINNAAIDAKVGAEQSTGFARVENFPLEKWDLEMDVGLKGAFICSQIFGG